jgi:hypothetical protein
MIIIPSCVKKFKIKIHLIQLNFFKVRTFEFDRLLC